MLLHVLIVRLVRIHSRLKGKYELSWTVCRRYEWNPNEFCFSCKGFLLDCWKTETKGRTCSRLIYIYKRILVCTTHIFVMWMQICILYMYMCVLTYMISLHRLFTCNANAPHADLSVQRFWAGKCSWIRVVSNRFHQPQKKHNEPQLPDSLFWRWLNLQHKKRCRFGFTVLTSFSKAAEKGEMVMPQAGDQVRGGADKKVFFFFFPRDLKSEMPKSTPPGN